MFTITEILKLRGINTTKSKIKMIRHQHPPYDLSESVRRDQFDLYQWTQGRKVYNCEIVISFIGIEGAKAKLVGVYKIMNCEGPVDRPWPKEYFYQKMKPGKYFYSVERLEQFSDLENRLVINWGKSTRSWHQWLKDRPIIEILPQGHIGEFPGYLEITLSFSQLTELIFNPDSNRIWHNHLSAVGAVYLILDTSTGAQYIGSASGVDGILGRWKTYAINGHGGNKKLKTLIELNSEYKYNFRYSILQTLPKSLTPKETVNYESKYKEKLGTKAFGLNEN